MPTNRKTLRRGRRGQMTPQIVEKYRRLWEIERQNLPFSDPIMQAWGERDRLQIEITTHFGLEPWMDAEWFEVGDALAEAAGLERHDRDYFGLT